ncbi:MAG: Peptide-methionine (R)-S-oxide reductase MsrB [uncultured Sphingosinicella sp.]|uniref:peptide-methionine (R)-S-oxide reductase n=1 Tax=uncultured Sphingosinicella sp. TaxID=478748 RepID=A0A6J4TL11_9SPHN|nr:peptide-methionine (R)-S-oxide reductase MsrB [uncultured Sphingosinicella sp.]CAA9525121.1 MAG: Peptide-methionine (R)-S-oxide reductase MsrB [uncultured Sphingosinicella sp.]
MQMNRRLLLGGAGAGLLGGVAFFGGQRESHAAEGKFPIKLSQAEWKKRLTPQQYAVLREENTERAGSSPLNKEKRKGTYVCAGCGLPLYSSATKFESGTGWPSFWKPLANAVGTKPDNTLFATRTEVHCRRCGGHVGHVFDDGPKPTGLRYCMNGVAMKFRPA